MVAYYTWLATLEDYHPKRTEVGKLKLKRPRDFAGIYEKLETMIEWTSDTSLWDQYVWLPLVLVSCWEFDAMQYDKHGVGHCYDNIFADIYLEGGDEPEGIFGYVDVFTPGGYISMFLFSLMRSFFNEFVFNWVIGAIMGIVYYKTQDTMPLCVNTDTIMDITFLGTTYNLCNYLMF